MNARIRIYIPTYRRPTLLKRALNSLKNQTFENWVAEVHNDDPKDSFPGELITKIGDSRIRLVQHEENWGPLRSFNEFFSAKNEEEYVSLLEDDNAWEPEFLSQMISIMDADAELTMAWCNQSLDLETADGDVIPMEGKCARETGKPGWLKSGKYTFGHIAQSFGALHANGAMLLRTKLSGPLRTPLSIPFTGVEPYRERMIAGPMYYSEKPLGRFTVTRASVRGGEDHSWAQFQTGLLSSYLLARPEDSLNALTYCRSLCPSPIGVYIIACLAHPRLRRYLRNVSIPEWFRWSLTAIRRPSRVRACMSYQKTNWWKDLSKITCGIMHTSSSHE